MSKNKKSLLNESTIRRFMKLADIDVLSNGFIVEGEHSEEEDKDDKKEDKEEASAKKMNEEEEFFAEEEHADAAGEMDADGDMDAGEMDDDMGDMDGDDDGDGEAEISPEAAKAIIDLAAQLEASGAMDADAEEAEVEVEDDMAMQESDELEELEEALAGLGIEVVDDNKLNESIKKRVIARLLSEKREQELKKRVDQVAEKIVSRIKESNK